MLVKEFKNNIEYVWKWICLCREEQKVTWKEICERLPTKKLNEKAIHARAKYLSTDWVLLSEILSVLKCHVLVVIPDEGDFEISKILDEHLQVLRKFAALDPEDQKFVRVLIQRLSRKTIAHPSIADK